MLAVSLIIRDVAGIEVEDLSKSLLSHRLCVGLVLLPHLTFNSVEGHTGVDKIEKEALGKTAGGKQSIQSVYNCSTGVRADTRRYFAQIFCSRLVSQNTTECHVLY